MNLHYQLGDLGIQACQTIFFCSKGEIHSCILAAHDSCEQSRHKHAEVCVTHCSGNHIGLRNSGLKGGCHFFHIRPATIVQQFFFHPGVAGIAALFAIHQDVVQILCTHAAGSQLGQFPTIMLCHLRRIGIGCNFQITTILVAGQAQAVGHRIAKRDITHGFSRRDLIPFSRKCNGHISHAACKQACAQETGQAGSHQFVFAFHHRSPLVHKHILM